MIPRGQPFPKGPALVLACPLCLASGRLETLSSMAVFSLGPQERTDALDVPFYRYKCPAPGCGYVEVHMHLLRGQAS